AGASWGRERWAQCRRGAAFSVAIENDALAQPGDVEVRIAGPPWETTDETG
ncbi:hypothetical protein E2562_037176, partial [Oryza meyeriana var. granulata]